MYVFKQCWRDGLLYIGLSGLVLPEHAISIKQRIISSISSPVIPFRIMCDLRGMEPLHRGMLSELAEIEECLFASNVFKIGTVFDDAFTRMQHIRVTRSTKARAMLEDGRSKIFSDFDACWAWLMEGKKEGTRREKGRL